MCWAEEVVNYALPKGGERKGTCLLIEEEYCNPMLAFSFVSYFHRYSGTKQAIARISKMGVTNIFPRAQSSFSQF